MAKKLIRGELNPEYERKWRPIPPKRICKNALCRFLGIVSPSLLSKNQDGDVEIYEIETLKHLCYKRRITFYQWKTLYRRVRTERKLKKDFDGWFEKFERGMVDAWRI